MNNDIESRLERLVQTLDASETTWDPAPGEHLTGTVQDIEYRATKNGTLPTVKVRTLDGSIVKVAAGRVALRNELDRKKVQPGDLIAIRYMGEQESKNGGRFHNYRVNSEAIGPRNPALAFDKEREVEDDLGLTVDAVESANYSEAPGF